MAINNKCASDTFATSPGNATISPASPAPAPARRRNLRGVGLIAAGCLLLLVAGWMLALNAYNASVAGSGLDEIVAQIDTAAQTAPTAPVSNQQQLCASVDGVLYAGVLEIPDLGLTLPVQASLTYAGLRQTPCVYSGAAQTGNLVVAAHNYPAHFGNIKQLRQGQEVRFTDARGIVYTYQVSEVTVLAPTSIDEMTSSDGWDLTLFTCTIGGRQRVTVRCVRTLVSAG